MKFAVEDPDAPENWPRLWIIWRGNALMSSAKGHEYFLKHYLGTHTNSVAPETAEEFVKEVIWHDKAPEGKLDLVVDINFRMDTSALYSDIVLPTATWYEKDDLNTTDMHSFIHPLQAAVPPCWESKSDWDIFKGLAKKVSELAEVHLPDPVRDIVAVPLQHDTPAEMAQPEIKDWSKGECEPIPGKTMPGLVVVERDYKNLYNRFISFGPEAREGIGAHGLTWPVEDYYDEMAASAKAVEWGGKRYPTLSEAKDAAEVILKLAPETNGEMAYPRLRRRREEGRPAADRSGGRYPRRAHHLRRSRPPAAAAAQQPDLDRADRQRPGLFGLLPQRREAGPLADPDRPPALLSRSSGLHRRRRTPADLQAEARSRAACRICWSAIPAMPRASCSTT